MKIEILPNPEQNYDGRQWGYTITLDGQPYMTASTGGTGPCWNVDIITYPLDPDDVPMHVCDLDELIAALTALRDSQAHRENVERWE